jgi:hypothetical protein
MRAYLDSSREGWRAILGPGNAGSSTGSDQVAVVLGVGQLPCAVIESASILVPADGAGAMHTS